MMKDIEFNRKKIELHIPSFEATNEFELQEPLEKFGMPSMFKPSQDVKKMVDSDDVAWISKVIHKVYVKVDKKGTTAAAVTGYEYYARNNTKGNI
jgi:serine protease inhibitor